MKKQKTAFTLAEALVTLAIIGVVAALTIPTVVKNYQKQQTLTRLRKVYSELQQAINLSQVDNGFLKEWDFSGAKNIENSGTFFDKYLKPYLKISRRCPDGLKSVGDVGLPIGDCGISASWAAVNYLLANGSSLSLAKAANIVYINVDVNGSTGPNVFGRDNFNFMLDNSHTIYPDYFPTFNGITREEIKNNGSHGCTKEKIKYPYHQCAALIMFDNWQIKDDYPWQ